MPAELKQHRVLIENPALLKVNWLESKEIIARFSQDAISQQVTKDKTFLEDIPARGLNIQQFLYDLGHPLRGFEEFPKTIGLIIPKVPDELTDRNNKDIISVMSYRQFFSQINQEVEQYIVDGYRKRRDLTSIRPDSYKDEIDILNAISKGSNSRDLTVTFSQYWREQYKIKKIQNHRGLTYED